MSQDSSHRRAVDVQFDLGTDDRDDIRALERVVRLLAEEVRTRFDMLDAKLEPLISKNEDVHEDISVRLNRHDKELVDHQAQLTALKQSAQRRLKGKR